MSTLNNNSFKFSNQTITPHPQYGNFKSIKSSSLGKASPENSPKNSSSFQISLPVKENQTPFNNVTTATESTTFLFSSAAKRLSEAFVFWKMNSLANFRIPSQEFVVLEKELEKQDIKNSKCKEALKWLINNNGDYENQFKKFGICLYIVSKHIYVSKQTALDALYESARQGALTFSELQHSYYIDFIKKMDPDVSLTLEQLALIIKKILKKRFP
uniref:Uncharacterized protein n=1 Tax=Strongyloides papillosus TaxID=174720 RepID=A0A0N5B8F9_STREA